MGKETYKELKKMLCDELEMVVNNGQLSAGTLETAHMITDTIKNIEKIEALEADEYSEDDGMSYRGGYSGARHWVRGHYSRDARGGGMSYRGGNSYRGYSGRDDMMVKLGEMMPEASEEQREILERAMRALEKI